MPCTTSVIRKACAVVRVCPAGGDSVHRLHRLHRLLRLLRLCLFLAGFLSGNGVSTSPNMTPDRWFLSGIRSPGPAPKWNCLCYGGIQEGRFGSQHDLWDQTLCFLRRSGHHHQFSSVQISKKFASVFFGDSVTTASFLRCKFRK